MSAPWSWLTRWLRSRRLTRIAIEHARKQGVDVNNYVVSAMGSDRDECWVVFEGKSRRVGDHFSIRMDCSTGKFLRLIAGH
jgi:hypothetical protein